MSSPGNDMPSIDELLAASADAKPTFLREAPADGLVAAIMRLAMELSVVRERLDVVEHIAARHEPDLPSLIDSFEPDSELEKTRAARRRRLLELLIRDLS
ncbi:MAG: hypothetical protein ABR578_08530 [Chromatocurvus sp.]